MCNFVTQARLPPTAHGSPPAHGAHTVRRHVFPAGRSGVNAASAWFCRWCVFRTTFLALHAHCSSVFTASCVLGNRPQPRPQMVVVENPPTVDDEGKMVRALARAVLPCFPRLTRHRRCPTWPSVWRKSKELGPAWRAAAWHSSCSALSKAHRTIFDLRRMRCSARWPFSGTCQCNVACVWRGGSWLISKAHHVKLKCSRGPRVP